MLRLTQEQLKNLSSLKQSPAFYKLKTLLIDEQSVSIKGLTTAKDVVIIHQLQGRLQLLDELLIALQD